MPLVHSHTDARFASSPQLDVSVLVPAYRSAETLPSLVERVEGVLKEQELSFEIVVVCDDGLDETWEAVVELAAARARLTGIRLLRNYGQHNALLCGIEQASGATIVTLDDDLQHPPEEIPKLLAELQQGWDVVYGTPNREQHGWLRDLASQAVKVALKSAMGVSAARNVSAFRAFRTELRAAFVGHGGAFVSIDVLLSWATERFSSVEVEHLEREAGRSGYTNLKLVNHAINMLTGYSAVPLRIASFIGFSFTMLGGVSLAWVVGRYLVQGTPVAGFPFLGAIISIFAGAQLTCLGIIGEYLARMHFRSLGRPTFAVRARTDTEVELVET